MRLLLLPLAQAALLGPPPKPPHLETLQRSALSALLGLSLAVSPGLVGPALAATDSTAGFEEFAADGGTMKADPNCFFKECGDQTKACFSNPACLKGITCLGNCRGEQLCATQCFARFGSEKLNSWLGCTLEEKSCVTTGVAQDNRAYYDNPPPAMKDFTPADLEGEWYKVLGYNPKYDTYPCQINTFTKLPDGGLSNDILFRVPKPGGGGAWVNNFVESMADSKGPQNKACTRSLHPQPAPAACTHSPHPQPAPAACTRSLHPQPAPAACTYSLLKIPRLLPPHFPLRVEQASMTVEGKMFGLTFHEQWYVLGKGDGYRVVAYKGDTQQGPYEGAFVYTKAKTALTDAGGAAMRGEIDTIMRGAGLEPKQLSAIDNACPTDATTAGVSSTEASKEKLERSGMFMAPSWQRHSSPL